MSEKKELEMNEIDIQAAIADWIVANDGCGDYNEVSCSGDYGRFKGVRCPISRSGRRCYLTKEEELIRLNEWLDKYNQQKSEAAEAEKQKAEAAKKQEQDIKQEPAKICGICGHVPGNIIDIGDARRTVPCEKKGINVPPFLEGCLDFEPRDDDSYQPPAQSEGDVNASAFVERIYQLEKENARLAEEVSGYKERTRRILELCEVIEMGVDQGIKAGVEKDDLICQLRNANSRSIGEARRAEAKLKDERRRKNEVEKENFKLSAKSERLTEQCNRLSNDLVKTTRRAEGLELENTILRSLEQQEPMFPNKYIVTCRTE